MSTLKKQVLILVDNLDVNHSSGARANYALIANLNDLFEVSVIHYSSTNIKMNLARTILIRERRFSLQYILSRFTRLLRRHFGINFSRITENILGFSFTFYSIVKGFREVMRSINPEKFDLVITLSQGESFIPHFAVLKSKSFHKRWLAYIHDPYPMLCYPKSYAWNGPGSKIKKRFMQSVFNAAFEISFPSKRLAQWMEKYYVLDKKKIKIIPHQINETQGCQKEKYLDEIMDKAKFNILHAGNLLAQRDPTTLIFAFESFAKKYEQYSDLFQLTFIGPVSPVLTDRIKCVECEKIKFIPPLDFIRTLELQKLAYINVIIEAPDESSPFLPAKFPHLIMTGSQMLVIGPKKSEVMSLLGAEHNLHVEHHQTERLTQIFCRLFEKWKISPEKKFYRDDLQFYMGKEYLKALIKLE